MRQPQRLRDTQNLDLSADIPLLQHCVNRLFDLLYSSGQLYCSECSRSTNDLVPSDFSPITRNPIFLVLNAVCD